MFKNGCGSYILAGNMRVTWKFKKVKISNGCRVVGSKQRKVCSGIPIPQVPCYSIFGQARCIHVPFCIHIEHSLLKIEFKTFCN